MEEKEKNRISVFEHECLTLHSNRQGKKLSIAQLQALQRFYGEKGVPYFSLIHNGVRFNEFVGVIQLGKIQIEVLPKADKNESDHDKWSSLLISMLRTVGAFDIHAPSSSALKIKSNTILDLYFEMFIKEVEYLLHQGLIKKYRKKDENVTALKGSLQFARHIQQNLTHQQRFYVRHTRYDREHQLHFILYKTIRLLQKINTCIDLQSRIGALLLHFPEMPDLKVNEATFQKLIFTRKNKSYKKAIEIARLLLLQYHPDVKQGRNHVLALMFDMNKLWEKFVYVSLRKHKVEGVHISCQTSKFFWQPESGYRSKIRPDILVSLNNNESIVLDTKWKNLNGYNPSPDDLRQMYVYHEYFDAKRVALVYPGDQSVQSKGIYLHPESELGLNKECGVITVCVEKDVKLWQKKIYDVCLTGLIHSNYTNQ